LSPLDSSVQEIRSSLSKEFNVPIEVAMTSPQSIRYALNQYRYIQMKGAREGTIALNEEDIAALTDEVKDFRKIDQDIRGLPLSQALAMIFAAAIKINASDIHFQPEVSAIHVRFRIDGVLHDIFTLKPEQYSQIKKRIKLIAKLKINLENKPQDGGCSITIKDKKIDLRISALPTNYGESIVIRILNPQALALDFEALGVRGQALSVLNEEIKKPNGMILTCGPTGSGKTTTLYTVLKLLNTEDRQIITLEDPIEYKLEGVLQTQVDEKNLSFGEGLKAALRQDPDIVMVGEIRDLETAETAINASLTGHLVISTLHTNNAAGAIPRFLAMGVKPYLLGPSINVIIGQRLVRRLCGNCKEGHTLDPSLYEKVKHELSLLPEIELSKINFSELTFYTAPGCEHCHWLGLKGRIGIFEVLKCDETIIGAIQNGQLAEDTVFELAREQGMIRMVQDGLLKALDGITTVEEVYRVTA
jgi:type II secretory ATPase GspE/PulE/Tfp pilus assembly ATPase PilB-like protein